MLLPFLSIRCCELGWSANGALISPHCPEGCHFAHTPTLIVVRVVIRLSFYLMFVARAVLFGGIILPLGMVSMLTFCLQMFSLLPFVGHIRLMCLYPQGSSLHLISFFFYLPLMFMWLPLPFVQGPWSSNLREDQDIIMAQWRVSACCS